MSHPLVVPDVHTSSIVRGRRRSAPCVTSRHLNPPRTTPPNYIGNHPRSLVRCIVLSPARFCASQRFFKLGQVAGFLWPLLLSYSFGSGSRLLLAAPRMLHVGSGSQLPAAAPRIQPSCSFTFTSTFACSLAKLYLSVPCASTFAGLLAKLRRGLRVNLTLLPFLAAVIPRQSGRAGTRVGHSRAVPPVLRPMPVGGARSASALAPSR